MRSRLRVLHRDRRAIAGLRTRPCLVASCINFAVASHQAGMRCNSHDVRPLSAAVGAFERLTRGIASELDDL